MQDLYMGRQSLIKGKKCLALIPARGGSKGLKNKNIKELAGKPLINWTIETALNSKLLDRVIVSTDSKSIASIAKDCGAEVPFLRPEFLASDTASSVDVVLHVLEFMKSELNEEYEYLVLLEPTSPIREKDDIDQMLKILESRRANFDSIVSIGEVATHPFIMKKVNQDRLENFIDTSKSELRRQDLPEAYFPYGVAYIVKVDSFLSERSFYTKRNTYFKIKRHQCFEIDDLADFRAVEGIVNNIEEFK